jgi:hypothetical protein
MPVDRTREALVQRLAEVSHRTWMKQKANELGRDVGDMPGEVTDHDLERAEDTVQELERLELWPRARDRN